MLDNSDEIKNNKLKKLLKKIEQEFQIKFIVNTDKYPGYLNRDYSIYRQQKPYKMTNKYSEVVDEYFA
ncbi:MAG: hypothetical protein LBP53_08040 [Candidatus Peribacteria bacterium]|jgi:hypothetical protein|nr:hypothetical protein [Candidatus Peribacteria bacterium]